MTLKVLMLNGSPHPHGNTERALEEIADTLKGEGVESEIVQLGAKPVRGCIGCRKCHDTGRCIFDDDAVNEFVDKARGADGFVFGTPVYYAHPAGQALSFLDRAFYSGGSSGAFRHKPAASVSVARRGGATTSFDVMNKYFGISEMPVVSSTYWNIAYGQMQGEVEQDPEGMQTMRNVAHNMAWLLKCIELGKASGFARPASEYGEFTNFVR
ncbi:MAG: flavodoxin family protein [Coriobacteriales bacterium]|jgi:multimeric flavodoxin WrbA